MYIQEQKEKFWNQVRTIISVERVRKPILLQVSKDYYL